MQATAERADLPAGVAAERRGLTPVKVCSALGGLFLGIEAFAVARWLTSERATRTPTGPDPIPGWMEFTGRTWEILGLFGLAAAIWFFIVKPWRIERRLTLDGLFALVFLSLYWQDTMLNYSQVQNTYNAMFWNLGSWNSDIPGWGSPGGHLIPQPILWAGPIYLYILFTGVVVANLVMRAAKRRWPRLSKTDLALICFAFFVVGDLLIEPQVLRLGINVYPGAIRSLSLFPGTYYQFPLYEAVFFPACCTAWACLRYFRNDKGETLAERGIDDLRLTGRRKTVVRFLALAGLCNAIFLGVYNVPMQFFGLRADSWPEDITKRSYLTNGLCGPGTPYACPGPDTPIARRGSSRAGSDGTLVPPGGAP